MQPLWTIFLWKCHEFLVNTPWKSFHDPWKLKKLRLITKLIWRIKPFFQQIFIENKTDLTLLLHQKLTLLIYTTYVTTLYGCFVSYCNVPRCKVESQLEHANSSLHCFACFLSFLLIPFVQLMIPWSK